MATIGELNVLLGGDAAQFEKAIQRGQRNLENLSRSFVVAGKDAQEFNLGMLNILSKQQGDIGKFSQKLKEDLDVIAKGLVDQGQASSTSEKGIRNLAAAQIVNASESRKAAEAVKQSQKEQADAMKMAEKAAKAYEMQLKTVSNSLWLMNNALRQIGISLTAAFTVPIIGAGVAAVKTFTDFERGTVAIQRSAEITAASAQKITDGFKAISREVPLTVAELQQAGVAAGQAGIRGEEAIIKFAETAVKLSKVGGDALRDLPLGDVTDQLAKISIAFGVAGDNFEQVTNVASTLLAVGKNIPGGLGEVIEAMRRTSGVAADMGVSFQTTTALVGTLVAAAIPASRAGTELSRAFLDVSKDLDKLAERLGYSGEQIDDFRERMDTDFGGVFIELLERLGAVESNVTRNAILMDTFGEVGRKAVSPLINNLDILNSLLEVSELEFERNTLLANDFLVQSSSLAGAFTVFASNVKDLADTIGKDLAPYVAAFLNLAISGIQKLIGFWAGLNDGVKLGIVGFAGFLAILGPVALALNTLFLQPLSGIVTFVTFLTRLTGATSILGVALGATNKQMFLMQGASVQAALGNTALASSMYGAATATTTLSSRLLLLLIPFAKILAVALAVVGALALLGKAFGVSIKLPSFKKPEFPDTSLVDPSVGLDSTFGDQSKLDDEARKDREKQLDEEQKALEKELKAKKKARDKEIQALNDNIREIEKQRNLEVKALQKAVDSQKDIIDARKDLWDEEKDAFEEQIDAQKELLDVAKEAVSEAKKVLNAIKKARSGEVDAAEGQADLAKASLEAAQAALKREVLLGRDEYDASFRAAEERVKTAEDILQLARENVVRIKREYEDQIAAQEAIVEAAEEVVDTHQSALDELQSALKQRQKIVDKEIKLLTEELEIRQDALNDVRDSFNDRLDILREEKEATQRMFDDEIDLMQERLDSIKEQNDAIKGAGATELPDVATELADLKEQLQKQVDALRASVSDIDAGGFGLQGPEIAIDQGGALSKIMSGDILGGLSDGLFNLGRMVVTPVLDTIFGKGFTAGLEEDARKNGTTVGTELWNSLSGNAKALALTSPLGQLLFGHAVLTDLQVKAKEAGLSLPEYIWLGLQEGFLLRDIASALLNGIFGEGSFEAIDEEAKRRGLSIPQLMWDSIVMGIQEKWIGFKDLVGNALFGEDVWEELKTEANKRGVSVPQLMWDGFTTSIGEKWAGLKQLLIDTIFGRGTWEELNKNSSGSGISLASALWSGFTQKVNELKESVKTTIIGWIPDPIKNLLGLTQQAGEQHGKAVETGVQKGGSGTQRAGQSTIQNLVSGILGQRGNVLSSVSNINSVISGLSSVGSKAYSWGQNLGKSLAEGIANSENFLRQASEAVGNLISRYFKSFSPPKEGVLKDIDVWGENLTKTLAEGMVKGSSSMMSAVDSIGKVIENNIGDIELGELAIAPVSGSIGTNISAGADQASIPALSREARLAEQSQRTTEPQTVVNRNINIQPGQMIASRGEIRSFVRMLREYEELENQR